MEMFKPQLKVAIESNFETYALDAAVVVPNGCYLSGGAHQGVPKGQARLPETEMVILEIIKREGFCPQALKTLEYHLPGLPLVGKNRVVAFATIGAEVVGIASKPLLQLEKAGSVAAARGESSGASLLSVSAWVNAMPGDAPRVLAVLNVFAPCLNYDFKIVDRGPFGITGRTLLLELQAKRPDICYAVAEKALRFEKKLQKPDEFDDVAVLFEGRMTHDPLEIIR